MQDIQRRVQSAVETLMHSLDHSHLRKYQKEMYECSAKCCDNDHYNMDDLQNCTERCSDHLNSMQQMIQNELQDFQSRLQRCAMECQDKTKDKMSTMDKKDESYMRILHGDMEKCVLKCADDNMNNLPLMTKRIQMAFDNKN